MEIMFKIYILKLFFKLLNIKYLMCTSIFFFDLNVFFSWSGGSSASRVSLQSQMAERNGTIFKVQFLVSTSKCYLIIFNVKIIITVIIKFVHFGQ